MPTFDQKLRDSAGAFVVGELERLDQTLHLPMSKFTYSRDIDFRTDILPGDESSSYTQSNGAATGIKPGSKAWMRKRTNQLASMQLDIDKVRQPLTPWGMELDYTMFELMSAQQLSRPLEEQKFRFLQLQWNLDIDAQVYIGDADLNQTGLLNNANVSSANAITGSWTAATDPDLILGDVNEVLVRARKNAGYAVTPTHLLLPPDQFGLLSTIKVSSAGNVNVLNYIANNCVSMAENGTPLIINSAKYAAAGQAHTPSTMMAYSKNLDYVRFPFVPLMRGNVEYRSASIAVAYTGKLGVTEFVQPETVAYSLGV